MFANAKLREKFIVFEEKHVRISGTIENIATPNLEPVRNSAPSANLYVDCADFAVIGRLDVYDCFVTNLSE